MIRTEPAPHVDKMEHTPRVGIRLHPLCELFPELSGAAFNELRDDIAKNGVIEPIVFIGDEILDGRNRYFAARELGIEYPRVQFTGDDPLSFVLAKNLARRHLTDRQRADIAAKLAKMPRGRPSENPAIAGITVAEAAKVMEVPVAAVERAKVIQEQAAPELKAAYEAGDVSQSAAAEVAKLPAEEQSAAVASGTVPEKAKEQREKRAAEKKPAPVKRAVVPLAEFEAVEAERDELREERDALLKDVADLKAEIATFADMKLEYERGGFAEIIANKDETIRVLQSRVASESAEKVKNLRDLRAMGKKLDEAGKGRDFYIDLDGGANG